MNDEQLVATGVHVTEAVGSAGVLAGGAAVAIRTVRSFSLDVGMDGVLPWRAVARTAPTSRATTHDPGREPS